MRGIRRFFRVKIFFGMLFSAISAMAILYISFSSVNIIAVYHEDSASDILVTNLPYSDNGKIKWWFENKNLLQDKYGVPVKNESFTVFFWEYSGSYKAMPKSTPPLSSETTDLLCFDEIKVKERCIDKNLLFRISKNSRGETFFSSGHGYFKQEANGELIEIKE